jgi:hypothetical protein
MSKPDLPDEAGRPFFSGRSRPLPYSFRNFRDLVELFPRPYRTATRRFLNITTAEAPHPTLYPFVRQNISLFDFDLSDCFEFPLPSLCPLRPPTSVPTTEVSVSANRLSFSAITSCAMGIKDLHVYILHWNSLLIAAQCLCGPIADLLIPEG